MKKIIVIFMIVVSSCASQKLVTRSEYATKVKERERDKQALVILLVSLGIAAYFIGAYVDPRNIK